MTTSILEPMPTSTKSTANSAFAENESGSTFIAEAPPAPLLENVVAAIRMDARRDSLRYALRSNVGHDGE